MFKRAFFTVSLLATTAALAACGGEADDTSPEEIELEDELAAQGDLTTPRPEPDPEPYLTCNLGAGTCHCTGQASCDKLKAMCGKAGGKYTPENEDPGAGPITGDCQY